MFCICIWSLFCYAVLCAFCFSFAVALVGGGGGGGGGGGRLLCYKYLAGVLWLLVSVVLLRGDMGWSAVCD